MSFSRPAGNNEPFPFSFEALQIGDNIDPQEKKELGELKIELEQQRRQIDYLEQVVEQKQKEIDVLKTQNTALIFNWSLQSSGSHEQDQRVRKAARFSENQRSASEQELL